MKVKLREIADLSSGYQGKIMPGDSYSLIKLVNVSREGLLNYQEMERFDAERMPAKYVLQKEDLIIKAKSGDHTAVLIEENAERLVATAHFIIIRIRKAWREKINPAYLVTYLNSQEAQDYLMRHATGTTLPIVKLSTLEEMEMPVPALKEQEKLSQLYRLMLEERKLMKRLMIQREKQLTAQLRQVLQEED